MANAISLFSESEESQFTEGSCTYTVRVDDGIMHHVEKFAGRTGEQVYHQDVPVDFAVGSGQRGYTFLSNRDGLLFQSPITWYSGQNKFALSPGYEPDAHPRFGRRVSDGCISCHSGRALPDPDQSHKFKPTIFSELSIGCERCHGPGGDHVDFHTQLDSQTKDRIVNPAKLNPFRRESVCYQCHLHGMKRVLREKRTEFDFRPGDLISDIWVVFQSGTGVDESTQTTAVSQVEQFVASQCFQKSDGSFGCTSCHDPHRREPQVVRTTLYNEKCASCHQAPDSECGESLLKRNAIHPKNSCVQCHMPSLNAGDVPHTSQTDHRILKRPLRKIVQNEGQIDVFELESFPIPQNELQRAYGLALGEVSLESLSKSLSESSINILRQSLQKPEPDTVILDVMSSLLVYQDLSVSEELALQGHHIAPQNESLLETLAIVGEAQGNEEKALQWVEKYLELNANDAEMWTRKARLLMKLANEMEAKSAAERAISVNPTNVEARKIILQVAEKHQLSELIEQQAIAIEELESVQEKKNPSGK